jgi:copper transport protein
VPRLADVTRPLRRILVIAVLAVIAALAVPGTAQAHSTLLFTTPAADAAESVSPSTVVLVFNEPVTVTSGGLLVMTPAGRSNPVGNVTTVRGGTTVTGRLSTVLPTGVYTVRWRVTGADGDLVESTFRFAVGAALTSADASSPATTGTSWPSAGWRWLLFLSLALTLGGMLGARLTDTARTVRATLPAVRTWHGASAAAGLIAAAGLAVSFIADTGAKALLTATPGRVILAEGAAFAVCLALLRLRPKWAWLPLLAVPVAEGLRGHVEQAAHGWGALLISVHLAAIAVWVGALVHVVVAAVRWRAQRPAVVWMLVGYARWAIWLFAAVVATGTASAVLLVPVSALTSTTYGRWLLVKLALVVVAISAAVSARWWLRRGEQTVSRIAWATRVEAGVLTGVLAVTAVLVSTPTAGSAQTGPLAPPAPKGVVVPLGALAGQVGVAVAASDHQLVVRLSAPSRGDLYSPGQSPSFALTGGLVTAGQQSTRTVRWNGCGPGCFLAPVDWGAGDNLLTLKAKASGWPGGTVSLVVPWPVRPAAQQLARAVATLKAAGQVTVYEAVTSDTSQPAPEPTPLQLSGADFVATEPYSSGAAAQTVVLRQGSGTTRLALGYPADGRYAELTLDGQDRIVEEVLVDATHLTRRRFVYPTHGPE